MVLVERLHQRYLWAEQLCIIHDDDRHKIPQIDNMAAIFARASLTIVTFHDRAADTKLRGLLRILDARSPRHRVVRNARERQKLESILLSLG
ncbi:hypothetical protein QBC33DRAFT_563559 [Phialemonium atrogriseum]|uniref:Heterokaryon incompatibility domain-containing protein n=1 Tax=Phialemonium atrogriseum TaxID=1093897 RepID=A0AAJ0BTH1_9PEZI|nr:uncharacterized protein QBC33DRAFT_563559 [Phialemonium atrogriseum]KAK1762757.1 hypothetical protein QBC33DRAFT_563559 [Phialemonium atrogriseum]